MEKSEYLSKYGTVYPKLKDWMKEALIKRILPHVDLFALEQRGEVMLENQLINLWNKVDLYLVGKMVGTAGIFNNRDWDKTYYVAKRELRLFSSRPQISPKDLWACKNALATLKRWARKLCSRDIN